MTSIRSELSSVPPSRVIPSWLIWGFVVVSFLGFIDATYLAMEHLNGAVLNCYIFSGCDEVLASEYAITFGIPTAFYGVVFYLLVLLSSLHYLNSKDNRVFLVLPPLTTLGFFTSLLLLYLQAFVIEAFCTYCIISVITSTTLFVFGVILFKGRKVYRD